MTYEIFWAGVGATLLGTLLGAWLGARLNYGFQKKLLAQQLEFQQKLLEQQLNFEKQQGENDSSFRRKLHDEWITTFTEFRNLVNETRKQIGGAIKNSSIPR